MRIGAAAFGRVAGHPLTRELVRHVLVPFLVQRSAVIAAATFLGQFLPPDRGFHTGLPRIVDMWVRWDAIYYLSVASHGYGGKADAFFPLFPWLSAGLALVVPLPVAAVLVANAAAVAALCLLYVLLRDEPQTAQRAVVTMLLFPTSFFLSAVYPESTFVALAVGAFVAARSRRNALAALCVLGACLARPQGFLSLSVPFAGAWLLGSRRLRELPWFVLAAPLALLLLVLVHHLSTGDALGFLHARSVQGMRVFWGAERPSPPPLAVLWDEGMSQNLMRRLLNWSALALVLAACVHLIRRREIAYALFCIATLAMPLYFHATLFDAASMARYALMCFPVFIALGRWTAEPSPWSSGVDWGMAMLQAILLAAYSAWMWVE